LKDAARLLVYFAATILIGALLAPLIYWACQGIAAHGIFPFLAHVDFERYFRRALLVAALLLLWPLLRSLRLNRMPDFGLEPNPRWARDILAGLALAAIPLLCCSVVLVAIGIYSVSPAVNWPALGKLIPTTAVVPLIEETFFRGFILGIFLRTGQKYAAILLTSAFYSLVHFLKAPDQPGTVVTWTSGFNSIAHSFAQFADPTMVMASFATLFLIGLVLAHGRIGTRSLWLPIGLHAGWILANGAVAQFTDVQRVVLPWLGRNLLVGIVPLGLGCLTWVLLAAWLKHYGALKN